MAWIKRIDSADGEEMMKKYHIEENSVQETLVIPLYARLICSRHYPELFNDPEAEKICVSLDYDFETKGKAMESFAGLFGALEVAQRQNDLLWEINDYLVKHPAASIVNLGCGLDDSFTKADNGKCRGYNLDFEDVISIRKQILEPKENETNLACDLRDESWMDRIAKENGAIFFASGVFYYLKKEEVKELIIRLGKHFPGSVLVFDSCNRFGAKMMTKTWLKKAGISDVSPYFSLEDPSEIKDWSSDICEVSSRSYMRGYRDIYDEVSLVHKLMLKLCDKYVNMRIVKVTFK